MGNADKEEARSDYFKADPQKEGSPSNSFAKDLAFALHTIGTPRSGLLPRLVVLVEATFSKGILSEWWNIREMAKSAMRMIHWG